MPESPRWCIKNNRMEQARRSIERVAGVKAGESDPVVEHDLAEMQKSIEHENSIGTAGWLDCFKPQNKTLYRTILGMTLQSFQQLTGANYCELRQWTSCAPTIC
jgi:SP family sugar:H+ symporter-like MFS transporter